MTGFPSGVTNRDGPVTSSASVHVSRQPSGVRTTS